MLFDKNLPLLIFDLDGTLIDSAEDIYTALNQMLTKYGRRQVDLPTLISHIGDGLTKLVNDFFPEFHIDSGENMDKVREFLTIYETSMVQHTKLYPGVLEFLQNYEGAKAIITNKNIEPARAILKHFNIYDLPWIDILGGDSLAERKPSPLPLRHVMKKADFTPASTWMIGDGRPDMLSGQAAGCVKVAVHYGYSKPEELVMYQPHHILKNFSDLKALI
ncbi:MAG: HAD hydrolase-like protein [Bdellovibrio sp.]|nr:HAD hydrolase-like protein [Bdellovibrio sp.]